MTGEFGSTLSVSLVDDVIMIVKNVIVTKVLSVVVRQLLKDAISVCFLNFYFLSRRTVCM